MPPARTPEGDVVPRIALYQVSGDDVATPFTGLGGTVAELITADAPLLATPAGDNVTLSLITDQANGVPTLDDNGLVRMAEMPIAGLNYHGNWDAATNSPTLADGAGAAGDFYRVSAPGTQNLGSGNLVFEVGDHVIYEGDVWQQFDPPQTVAWGDLTGTLTQQSDLQAALAGKVAAAGGTMTGQLAIVFNAATRKLMLAMSDPGTVHAAPSAFGVGSEYLHLGGGEWGSGSYRLIGLGYVSPDTAEPPAAIGYQETSTSSNTRGDLVFATRPNNNNVAPTIILRINSAGQILAEAGAAYVPGSPGALTTKQYVDAAVAAVPPAPVTSVAGRTGIVVLTKTDVGLANVDNTADANKPVSSAQQTAINAKADTTALTAHTGSTGASTHLPAGGTTGQIPVKGTGTAVTWQDAPLGGGGTTALGAPATHTATPSPDVFLTAASPIVQLLDCTAADMEVHLPAAPPAGTRFILKRINAGPNGINIMGAPGDIDGVSTQGISSQYSYKDLVFDGANWWIIGSGGT